MYISIHHYVPSTLVGRLPVVHFIWSGSRVEVWVGPNTGMLGFCDMNHGFCDTEHGFCDTVHRFIDTDHGFL